MGDDDEDQNPLDLGAISSTFSHLSEDQVYNMTMRNNRLHRQILEAAQRGVAQLGSGDVKPDVPDVMITGVASHHITAGVLLLDPHPTLNHVLTCSCTFLSGATAAQASEHSTHSRRTDGARGVAHPHVPGVMHAVLEQCFLIHSYI